MKLNPRPRKLLRVHELAAELGWTSRQLLGELSRRGEFVKSASSTLEAPIVRAIRRDFAPASARVEGDMSLPPELYGHSADLSSGDDVQETFQEAVNRVKAEGKRLQSISGDSKWVSPVLRALTEEAAKRNGGMQTSRARREAHRLHREWAAACLQGLEDDESTLIKWIKLSGGRGPLLATELSQVGITAEEASLHLGYNGRIEPRWPNIFDRYRDRKINRSEALAAVRWWRATQEAG